MTRNHASSLLQAICLALPLCGVGAMHANAAAPSPAVKTLDTDSDGTVSLQEVKTAADRRFEALDKDHDGTLDSKETRGHLPASAFRTANPDRDGTIDKAEWDALVETRFKAADPDHDGTLTAKELASPAGKSLMNLLR